MLLMLNRAAGSGSSSVFSFANPQFGLSCRANKRRAESGPGPQTSTPVPRSEPLVGAAAGQYQTAGVRVPTAVAMPNLQGKLLGAGLYVGCPRYHQLTRLERLVKPGLVRCGSPKRRAVIKANGGGPSNILDGRAVNCGATPEVTLISGDSP